MNGNRASLLQAAKPPRKRKQQPPKITIDPRRRVRPTDLREMVRRAHQPPPPLPPPLTPLEAGFRLSIQIIPEFLGLDWLDYYLTRQGFAYETYLGGDLNTFLIRVCNLAEMLLNLQYKTGFEACLELLADGRLEAAAAELEVGKLLSYFDVSFSFNKPTGKAKSDYDLNVFFRNGECGCAETKCRIEDKTVSAKSILRKLKRARDQLPDDRPGVTFMRLPEQWAQNIRTEENIVPSVQRFIRGTSTVVAVELFISGYKDAGSFLDPAAEPTIVGFEIMNENHKFDTSRDWSLIGHHGHTGPYLPPIWWKSIPKLIDPTEDPRTFRP